MKGKSKRFGRRHRRFLRGISLLVIPLAILFFSVGYSFLPVWTPVTTISGVSSYSGSFALISLQVNHDDAFRGFTMDYEVSYCVLPDRNISARFHLLIMQKGSSGTTGNLLLGDESPTGVILITLDNNTVLDYDVWSYRGTLTWSQYSAFPENFPYDEYFSPIIYVWFNRSTPIVFKIGESGPDLDFEQSLVDKGLFQPSDVYAEMGFVERLFVGLPESAPHGFQVRTFRSLFHRLYYSVYSGVAVFIVYCLRCALVQW